MAVLRDALRIGATFATYLSAALRSDGMGEPLGVNSCRFGTFGGLAMFARRFTYSLLSVLVGGAVTSTAWAQDPAPPANPQPAAPAAAAGVGGLDALRVPAPAAPANPADPGNPAAIVPPQGDPQVLDEGP